MKLSLGFVCGLVVAVAGCGSKNAANPQPVDAAGSGSGSGSGSGNWTDLISRDWSVPPGTFDLYKCTRVAVPRDMWIAGFHRNEQTASSNQQGTHHQVLTISSKSSPLGDYDCSAGTLDTKMLYAAGLGTDDMLFPDGYAVHLTAGTYINLNLHLFNAGDTMITGHSGIQVKEVAAGTTPLEIDFEFAGNMNFTVPHTAAATGPDVPIQGGCTLSADEKIFALWPHMHQLANHQKFVITHTSNASDTLLDTAYAFTEQKFYPMATYDAKAGDKINVTCTYRNDETTNPGGGDVAFGDSSQSEMCFNGYYKYPAGGILFGCVTGF